MFERTSYPYFEEVNWGLLRLWSGRTDSRVLDVGCGFATTSERIQRLGNHVTGIESNADAAAVAVKRIDDVLAVDLLEIDVVRDRLQGRRFDCVIFADVLEHLARPDLVLRQYLEFLEPGGTVLISLPNVGLWSVRMALAFGRFDYSDTGVLDSTHLRFFTRRTALALLASAGLHPTRRTYNPGLVRPLLPLAKKFVTRDPAALGESPLYRAYLHSFYPVERVLASVWPGAFAFQMIFEARVR